MGIGNDQFHGLKTILNHSPLAHQIVPQCKCLALLKYLGLRKYQDLRKYLGPRRFPALPFLRTRQRVETIITPVEHQSNVSVLRLTLTIEALLMPTGDCARWIPIRRLPLPLCIQISTKLQSSQGTPQGYQRFRIIRFVNQDLQP